MATQTTIHLIDDIDGSAANEEVTFGLDGRQYKIDLSEANADKLRAALADFIPAARRIAGQGRGHGRQTPTRRSPEELQAAREWLRGQGHQVQDRGRIPYKLLALWNEHKAATAKVA